MATSPTRSGTQEPTTGSRGSLKFPPPLTQKAGVLTRSSGPSYVWLEVAPGAMPGTCSAAVAATTL